MNPESYPPPVDMSVVLYTPFSYDVLQPILCALQAQTVRERLELIVAVRSRAAFGATEAQLGSFGSVTIVEAGDDALIGEAKATAVKAATAPIIAFAEDHSFPESNWAEMLIAAHRDGLTAVGPCVRNPNPRTRLSTAAYYMHWGPWIEPCTDSVSAGIPPHNGSYRRAALLELEDRLPDLFLAEQFLQASLTQLGHKIGIDPRAIVSHTNVSKLKPWIGLGYWGGRLFGAMRARHEKWNAAQRAVRVIGAPMIPLVRLRRVIADIQRSGKGGELLPGIIPMVLAGLIIHAAGEAVGYALGVGSADRKYNGYEVSRLTHLADGELDNLRARWSAVPVRKKVA